MFSRRKFIAATATTWLAADVGCSSSGTSPAAPGAGGHAGAGATGASGSAGSIGLSGGAGSSGVAGSSGSGGSSGNAGSSGSAGSSGNAGSSGPPSGGEGGTNVAPPSAILDAHTHFFDPSRPIPSGRSTPVPWPPVGDVLYRTTLPPEYVALAKPLGIASTVTIEASAWLEDNQWVLNLAAMNPVITAFVGNLSEVLGTADFSAALSTLAANPLVRGIRVSPAQLTSANMTDFAMLAQKGLMIDVLGSPGDLMTVSAFAKSLPSLRIVIDHVANVKIDGKAPPSNWVSGMTAAASQPNVYCKVSALVEGSGMLGNAPTDVAFYRPTLDLLWQVFGEDRLVFGSNWPVSSPYAPLSTVLSIVQAYFADKGAAANDKYFAKNAKVAYGL